MRRNLLPAALLLLACSNLLFRAGRDYFPTVRDSLWKYHDGTDTSYVRVIGDSLDRGRSYTVISTDDSAGFWLKTDEGREVRRRTRSVYRLGGDDYELSDHPVLVYLLPLVAGHHWSETRDTARVIRGDTVRYHHRLVARVAGVETATVPAGVFEECYRLEFTETTVIRSSVFFDSATVNCSEWLAPDVGLVRRVSGNREFRLVEYRIGPAR